MEPLRPWQTACACAWWPSKPSPPSTSTTDAGCLLGKYGRARYYAAYEENATPLRRALAQEVKTLARLVNPDLPEPSTEREPPNPAPTPTHPWTNWTRNHAPARRPA